MEIGVSFTKDSVKKLYQNMGYKKTAENKKEKLDPMKEIKLMKSYRNVQWPGVDRLRTRVGNSSRAWAGAHGLFLACFHKI